MDKYEKLKELKTLLDSGLLNQDEFDKLKNEILFGNKSESEFEEKSNLKTVPEEKTKNERNIFEEVGEKNRNQQTEINKPVFDSKIVKSKNPNLKYYIIFSLIALALFLKFYVPAVEREILAVYSDSQKFQKIRKTSWILVTNSANKSNVYDTNSKRFLLNKWYDAKYDKGAFFDDITFAVDGNNKMCSEYDYHYLTEKGDDYLNSTIGDYNPSYSNSSSGNSSKQTCSWCGKSFTGEHYTHLGKISDCYSTNSKSSIGMYCSMKCCSEARRSSCPTCR